jgi:tetratricopeptide (TPR) repeat protein
MKRGTRLLLGLVVTAATAHAHSETSPMLASGAPIPSSLTAQQGRNSITGNIFGESRNPMADLHVELLDDMGMTISRARTNGVGRYVFYNLPTGRYKIKVLTYGTDYIEQIQDVSLLPLSASPGSGAENQQVDFYLRMREGANAGPFYAPGRVFAQEVPDAARKLYEKGVGELGAKKEKEGFASLKRALEIFPTYYEALNRLGTEYVVLGNRDRSYLEAALILLSKAVEINPNSYSSSFGLGFTQYQLGFVDQSIVSLQRAVTNYNKSFNAHLWLGIALKRAGKLEQAEAALKRANELTKGKHADVHWHLAQIYRDQKRYAEAASALELFLKTQPDARDAEKIRQVIAELKVKASKS